MQLLTNVSFSIPNLTYTGKSVNFRSQFDSDNGTKLKVLCVFLYVRYFILERTGVIYYDTISNGIGSTLLDELLYDEKDNGGVRSS